MASSLATLSISKSSALKVPLEPLIVHSNSQITIGRSGKCDMSFPDLKSISHVHCYVRNRCGVIEIKSMSSNKTLFDSKPLPKDDWYIVRASGTLMLSSDSKIRIDVRIGEEALTTSKHKGKTRSKRQTESGIAEIVSLTNPRLHHVVPAPAEALSVASATIGRSKGTHRRKYPLCFFRLRRCA